MAERNSSDSWPARLAESVGRQVKRYRERPESKMSAQALADRTAELGHEIKRSVIANLESGRRDFVSVADLLVLAKALDVPPMALLIPIEGGGTVEILNGAFSDPWHAVDWFNGWSDYIPATDSRPSSGDFSAWYAATEPFTLKLAYDELLSEYDQSAVDAQGLADNPTAHELAVKRTIEINKRLRALEVELQNQGIAVPTIRRRADERGQTGAGA
ncbi:helix-turn-helix domain-containing protein [Agromyces humatus]|nr:helix-turn-helix transcriptional regulator [Agromyces humatus]